MSTISLHLINVAIAMCVSVIAAPNSRTFTPYAVRPNLYAETGGLLDIPDVGYYSDSAPWVNASRLHNEVLEVQSLRSHLSPFGFNAFTLFTPSIEDFVNYDSLNLTDGQPVFQVGDRHLQRTPIFASAINDTLATFHIAGMKTFLTAFEPSRPPGLELRINITSWASPDLRRYFVAKYCELKRRVPVLDGMVIYAADDWDERADSRFPRTPPIFHTAEEMAVLATIMNDALGECGLELLFSTWTAGGVDDYVKFVNATPPNITLIAHLGTSFNDDAGLSPVVSGGGCKLRHTIVIGDMYRENDGWAHGLSVPARRWQTFLKVAFNNSCSGTAAFGSWGPAWTWPSGGTNLINTSSLEPPKSWAGLWNDFRLFTRGWTPQSAAVHIWAALAQNPQPNLTPVAMKWAMLPPLSLPESNAGELAPLVLHSGMVWASIHSTCAIGRWWMLLQASPASPPGGIGALTTCAQQSMASLVLASNFKSAVLNTLTNVTPTSPDQSEAFSALRRSVGVSELYVRTWSLFQYAMRVDAELTKNTHSRRNFTSATHIIAGVRGPSRGPSNREKETEHLSVSEAASDSGGVRRSESGGGGERVSGSDRGGSGSGRGRGRGSAHASLSAHMSVSESTSESGSESARVISNSEGENSQFGSTITPVTLATQALCLNQTTLLLHLETTLSEWAQYPREDVAFQVTTLDPNLFSRPPFFPHDNNRTVSVYFRTMQNNFNRECN